MRPSMDGFSCLFFVDQKVNYEEDNIFYCRRTNQLNIFGQFEEIKVKDNTTWISQNHMGDNYELREWMVRVGAERMSSWQEPEGKYELENIAHYSRLGISKCVFRNDCLTPKRCIQVNVPFASIQEGENRVFIKVPRISYMYVKSQYVTVTSGICMSVGQSSRCFNNPNIRIYWVQLCQRKMINDDLLEDFEKRIEEVSSIMANKLVREDIVEDIISVSDDFVLSVVEQIQWWRNYLKVITGICVVFVILLYLSPPLSVLFLICCWILLHNGAFAICTPHYLTNFVYNKGHDRTGMFGHIALQSGACSEWTVKTAIRGDVTVSAHVVSAGYDLQTEFLMLVPKSWNERIDYGKECRNRRTTCTITNCGRQNCVGLKADIRMC